MGYTGLQHHAVRTTTYVLIYVDSMFVPSAI